MICISIGNAALIDEVNRLAPPLVEIRYDLIGEDPYLIQGRIGPGIKVIATCRPGRYNDPQRKSVLVRAIEAGAALADIEVEAGREFQKEILELARRRGTEIIVSYHNFENTPSVEELRIILDKCFSSGGHIAKIACMTRTTMDAVRLLGLFSEEGRKVIIGMGEEGKITRIASLALGGEFTFASISKSDGTAPGQLTYSDLLAVNEMIDKK